MSETTAAVTHTLQAATSLDWFDTLVLFGCIGFFIALASHKDISYIGEMAGVVCAISSIAYFVSVILTKGGLRKMLIASAFIIATISYLLPQIDIWIVSILTHFSIILFTLSEVHNAIKETTSNQKT